MGQVLRLRRALPERPGRLVRIVRASARNQVNAGAASGTERTENLALPVAAQVATAGYLYFSAPYDIIAQSAAAASRIQIREGVADSLVTQGSRVTGATVSGETIEAEQVVVAAGAIGTPQLLHRSGIRPPALGRWLSYHPILISQLVLNESLCAAPGVADREPRLQIPPTDSAEWYSLVLRDVSPFQPTDPDLTIDPNRLVEMQMLCPVDVNERSGIRFDDRSQPTFDVPLSAADQARLTNAEKDANALASQLGRYRSGCRPIWMPFGFAHMTGTTRMSAEENGTGVTDFDGRVWGFDNLHLVTNGLIPTRMAVNPTLTGVALSVRIADAIVSG
jgi:C-glycoside oxidase